MPTPEQEIEYFRVVCGVDEQSPVVTAARLATQDFLREVDDTPENRALEVNAALDKGYSVEAVVKFVSVDGEEPFQAIELYRLGEGTVGLKDNDSRMRQRGIRRVLLIQGRQQVEKGDRITVEADTLVMGVDGESVMAGELLQPEDVITISREGAVTLVEPGDGVPLLPKQKPTQSS
ncbi:MAG TPA: hypothetical protein VLE74_03200 [Candidatus Saccharimonadales bacterium]|nr:hypothetical protein [Candidatus Saccharimonadales bacterium]